MTPYIPAVSAVYCSWSNPGTNPMRVSPGFAIDNFTIPFVDRQILKYKVSHGFYDGSVTIGKTSVWSKNYTFNTFMLMEFGNGKTCYGVDRSSWRDDHTESGALYCSGDYCIMIPAVCGNVTQLFNRKARPFTSYSYTTEGGEIILIPDSPTGQIVAGGSGVVHHAPEPSTLALVILGAWILVVRRFIKKG